MRLLLIVAVGFVHFVAMAYGYADRRDRLKQAACGLLLLLAGVYEAGSLYDLEPFDVLLLKHDLPGFDNALLVDMPLVWGYAMLWGAILSMFFPVRSRGD